MKRRFAILLLLFLPLLSSGQNTWWGEYSFFAGGGVNDLFRIKELIGSESVTGDCMWTAGVDLRRLFGDHFSLETGLAYSHQYYYKSPAPGIEGDDQPGNFGLMTLPMTARVDFLKWFFADAGAVLSFQTGSSGIDNMTGLGATVGIGLQHSFRSDVFIRIRAYASQFAILHFIPDDYPQTLFNSGVMVGVGYRFIRLGQCNCPAGNSPR